MVCLLTQTCFGHILRYVSLEALLVRISGTRVPEIRLASWPPVRCETSSSVLQSARFSRGQPPGEWVENSEDFGPDRNERRRHNGDRGYVTCN